MLRAPLRNQDHRDAVLAKRAEQPLRRARNANHACAFDVDERHAIDAGDALHGVNRIRRPGDERAGFLRRKRVLDPDRNPLLHRRRHRLRMDHLCAEVSQLHRLVVRERVDDGRIGHAARIGAEHAIDVGPDHNLLGVEQVAEDRRGEVAAVPSEGRLQAFGRPRDEAGDHERRVDLARNHLQGVGARVFPADAWPERTPVDAHDVTCVDPDDASGPAAARGEIAAEKTRRPDLAKARHQVAYRGRGGARQVDGMKNAGDVLAVAIENFGVGIGGRAGDERPRHLDMALA